MVGGTPVTGRLYADSSATGGALSCQRIMLTSGASGAALHHHNRSSELFYVVSGAAEMLAGGRVRSAHQGDLVVVPPGTVHAFAAAPASDADLLIRHLERIAEGQARSESILEVHELNDNYFDQSPLWQPIAHSQDRRARHRADRHPRTGCCSAGGSGGIRSCRAAPATDAVQTAVFRGHAAGHSSVPLTPRPAGSAPRGLAPARPSGFASAARTGPGHRGPAAARQPLPSA